MKTTTALQRLFDVMERDYKEKPKAIVISQKLFTKLAGTDVGVVGMGYQHGDSYIEFRVEG